MPRESEPLVDSTLDSELEALLAVEPSAEFNRRVLAGVASGRPLWALSWVLAPAGALAAAALVVVLVTQLRPSEPTAPTLAGRPVATPPAAAPAPRTMPPVPAHAATLSTGSRPRAARYIRRDAPRRPAELAVLVALDESRALGQWLARPRPMKVASVTDNSPLPLSVDATGSIRPLHVPPLTIEPLPLSEDRSGGVRP